MPQFLKDLTYGTSVNLVSPSMTGTPVAPTAAAGTSTTQVATTAFVQGGVNNMARSIVNGRLTLVTGSPLGSGTGTTLYWTPFRGNQIGLYDGSANWNVLAYGPSDLSITVPSTTGLYDVFAYNNSGSVTLELGNAWSAIGANSGADGTRTDALTLQDGTYVKSANKTRRYLGSFYSTTGTASDTNQIRRLWNYYNQTNKPLKVNETASSWTWNGAWRFMNGNLNSKSYVEVVVGVSGNPINITSGTFVNTTTSGYAQTSIGYDSASPGHDYNFQLGPATASGVLCGLTHVTNIGIHEYYLLEWTNNITATFYGSGYQGISGQFLC